jgi:L-rhamnose mutarotase
VYALDLVDDPDVIERYRDLHMHVPDDVIRNLPETGIARMEIYSVGNRLINIIEAKDDYDPSSMKRDDVHPAVAEWEKLMSLMQVPLKQAKPGEKWTLMEKIYSR